MERMKELYEKVPKDSGLRTKFEEIMRDAAKEVDAKTSEKLIAFAKEAGYDVTVEEMQAFFMNLVEKAEGEIPEAELDLMAGGKGAGERLFSVATLEHACMIISAKKEKNVVCQDPI